jgi:hypothetical protein
MNVNFNSIICFINIDVITGVCNYYTNVAGKTLTPDMPIMTKKPFSVSLPSVSFRFTVYSHHRRLNFVKAIAHALFKHEIKNQACIAFLKDQKPSSIRTSKPPLVKK